VRATLAVAALAMAAVSCDGADTLLVVTVDADTPVAGITSLHARVTAGARTAEFDIHPVAGGAVDIPPAQNFGVVMPRALSGTVNVHVEARDQFQQPLAVGDGTGTLRAGARIDIQISLGDSASSSDMGTDDGGAVPGLQISPSPFAFSGTTQRTFAGPTQTFTISNSGSTVSAILPAASITGPNATSFAITNDGCVGRQIATNADSCTIDVRFTPSVSGTNSATLTVGAVSAMLSGTGTPIWVQEATNIDLSTVTLHGVWGADANDIYAVGDGATVLFRNATGVWSKQTFAGSPAPTTNLVGVSGSAPTDIWTSDGYHSTGNAALWMAQGPSGQTTTGIWVFSSNDAWVSFWQYNGNPDGNSGLFRFNLGGWTQVQNPDATNAMGLQHLWGTSGTDVYTFGSQITSCAPPVCYTASVIAHPDATGKWVQQYNASGGEISSMWGFGSPANNIYATSTGSVPLHSSGNGGWNTLPAPAPSGCAAVWGADPAHLLFACSANLYGFDGTTWGSSQLSGPTMSAIWGTSASNVYAVGMTAAGTGAVYHYY